MELAIMKKKERGYRNGEQEQGQEQENKNQEPGTFLPFSIWKT